MVTTELNERLYDKIGGWLVLPAFVHPIISILANLRSSYDLFALYSEKLPLQHQIFFGATALIGVAFAVAWFTSGYLAANLNPIFPKFYIGLNLAGIALSLLVAAVVYYQFGITLTTEDGADIIKLFVAACIWIPYMLYSKRVKATFYGIPMPIGPRYTNVSSPLKPSPEYLAQKNARHVDLNSLTMFQRLGMVIYWFFCGLAVISLAIGLYGSANTNKAEALIIGAVAAFISWLLGRAVKFIILGR